MKNIKRTNLPHPSSPCKGEGTKVAIAMSGGVDSAVAAKILVDQGYEVVGFMMKLWSDPSACSSRENACCDAQGVLDAKKVAEMLGIPFYLLNAKEVFKKHVADYFLEEYKNLRTPNPCVVCNDKIKFGWLLDFAKSVGCQYLATGHYARIENSSKKQDTRDKKQITASGGIPSECGTNNNLTIQSPPLAGSRQNAGQFNNSTSFHLLKGKDENKDQSYFLYNLNQEQLSEILFPVGEFTKTEVRALAKKWHLPVFEKRESQEICFIQDKDFREFLRRNIPASYFKPGEIVDSEGNILGKHEGLINYTIGQRKGVDQDTRYKKSPRQGGGSRPTAGQDTNKITNSKLQIQNSNDKQPLYVIGFDAKKNRLIVGEDSEVYVNKMEVKDLHFIQNNELRIMNNGGIQVKIRYRHPAVLCHPVLDTGSRNYCTDSGSQVTGRNDKLVVKFNEPQRAITPGQSAVFYSGDEVIGGGIIQ